MSKKKNKKVKKPILNSVIAASQATTVESNAVVNTVSETSPVDEMEELSQKYLYVVKDVKKLIIMLFVLTITIIAVYLLNSKTEFLNIVGDWIYKISNITLG